MMVHGVTKIKVNIAAIKQRENLFNTLNTPFVSNNRRVGARGRMVMAQQI